MLEVENLTKRYRGITSLDGASFCIRPTAITLVLFRTSFCAFGADGGWFADGITLATWLVLRKRRLAHWGGEVQVTGFAPE